MLTLLVSPWVPQYMPLTCLQRVKRALGIRFQRQPFVYRFRSLDFAVTSTFNQQRLTEELRMKNIPFTVKALRVVT